MKNAEIEQVAQQIEWIKASASKLPFADKTFDAVVSCLTFHEVKDKADKGTVVAEALRVVKSGGEFVFFDLFHDEKIFGDFDGLTEKIKACHAEITQIADIKALFKACPKILLLRKVLGYGVMICGQKK